MLTHLSLQNVGPAPKLELNLAPRLNLITGDNGFLAISPVSVSMMRETSRSTVGYGFLTHDE